MDNDTAIITLLIELQNDRAALRQRVVELEQANASLLSAHAEVVEAHRECGEKRSKGDSSNKD